MISGLLGIGMGYYRQLQPAFEKSYIHTLQERILACRYLAVNNLNRDFVDTRGFSVVFRRSAQQQVERQFPFFRPYLELALQPECNAFYLNPLVLKLGSRVDPHLDRSLRSYCKTVTLPTVVSVLYVQVPGDLVGGELVLRSHRGVVGQIRPQENLLVHFQGDLTHSINLVKTPSTRLSLVCEQYQLEEEELDQIPEWTIESRSVS